MEQPQAKRLPVWCVNIKKLREDKNETQEEFGERFGVTKQAVSSWETATYEPPVRVLVYLMNESGLRFADDDEINWTTGEWR
jgi:transcriptional regulator with XRE-family HTH domain